MGIKMLIQPSNNPSSNIGTHTPMLPSSRGNQMSLQQSNTLSLVPEQPLNISRQMPMVPYSLVHPISTQSPNITVNMSSQTSNLNIQMTLPVQPPSMLPIPTSNDKQVDVEASTKDDKILRNSKYKQLSKQPFKLTREMRIQSAKNGNRANAQLSNKRNQIPLQPTNGTQTVLQVSVKDGKELFY